MFELKIKYVHFIHLCCFNLMNVIKRTYNNLVFENYKVPINIFTLNNIINC